jgi:RimJ/RimL family protein N-acetyltransferase
VAATLRKMDISDLPYIVAWRNENAAYFPGATPLTPVSHKHWYYQTYLTDPADHMYMVTLDGEPVGTIGVRILPETIQHDFEIQRVLLGDKTFARSGVMTAALHEIYALYGHGWYRLQVLQGNERAIRFYEKNDFRTVHIGDEFIVMGRHA